MKLEWQDTSGNPVEHEKVGGLLCLDGERIGDVWRVSYRYSDKDRGFTWSCRGNKNIPFAANNVVATFVTERGVFSDA